MEIALISVLATLLGVCAILSLAMLLLRRDPKAPGPKRLGPPAPRPPCPPRQLPEPESDDDPPPLKLRR